jgi:hypothetical protein
MRGASFVHIRPRNSFRTEDTDYLFVQGLTIANRGGKTLSVYQPYPPILLSWQHFVR